MTDFTPPSGPPSSDHAADPPSFPAGGSGHERIGPDSAPDRNGGSKVWIFALVAIAAGVAAVYVGGSDGDDRAAGRQQINSASVGDDVEEGEGAVAEQEAATQQGAPPVEQTAPPESAPAQLAVAGQTAAVTIDGSILDQMPNTGGPTTPEVDSAIGQVAPTLTGSDFDGNEIRIGPDGRPKAIYFLAHWCPHCQVEVPTIQSLIDAGVKPDNLDIYAVSTAVSAERGNYPPKTWFDVERWSSPVMLDNDESSAVINYGAGGFPYVVFLDGDNRVITRAAGEMPAELMQQVWEAVAAS